MAEKALGSQACDLYDHWLPVSYAVYCLSDLTQEQPWALHQEALYQVHLPHSFLSDLPLHAPPGLSAYRQDRPPCTRASPNYCGMDDSALGSRCVKQNNSNDQAVF